MRTLIIEYPHKEKTPSTLSSMSRGGLLLMCLSLKQVDQGIEIA
jgi:hypothetical protein